MSKLQSPNFRVSKTRLIVYKPKTKNEKDLKKIFLNAVISRATKQKPILQQIKTLKDSKVRKEGEKSRPRGVAFLEFTEHQHALVALRVLINNPDIFGPEHRPIVEFALDNVQKLKLRAEKLQAQQLQGPPPHDTRGNFRQNDRQDSIPNSNPRIHRPRDGDASMMRTSDNRRGEWENKRWEGTVAEEVGNRRQKGLKIGANGRVFPPEKKSNVKVSDLQKGRDVGGQDIIRTNSVAKKEGRDAGVLRKRMPRDHNERSMEGDGGERNRKRRKRSDPVGRDVTDKLDLLIEQYRSKFTGSSSAQSGDKKQGSKSLKRWFQS